jgi:hypothetical protein
MVSTNTVNSQSLVVLNHQHQHTQSKMVYTHLVQMFQLIHSSAKL